MDKITYLAELAEGLARWVPERERQDILRYYAEYFEEAGPGREAEVVAELGDPWALSCRLAVEGGYVAPERAASWKPRKTWPRVLIGTAVGLTIFALVFGFGLFAMNIMRTVRSDPARYAGVAIVEAEPTAVLDWGMTFVEEGGYSVAFAEEGTALMDSWLIDGGSVDSFHSIDADVALGNIEIVAGDDYTLSVMRSGALSGYEPWWEVRNGILRLRDGGGSQRTQPNVWGDLKSMFDAGGWAVEVTITVPEGTVLNSINVETGLGDVLLWGVNAETVTAETGLGDVGCYEALSVLKLRLSTGTGDVDLLLEEVLDGLDVKLESGTGDVEVNLSCSEGSCNYELESGLGLVTVNGGRMGSKAVHKGGTSRRLFAESGTGSVNVHFNG